MMVHSYLGYFTHRRGLVFAYNFSVQPHISSFQISFIKIMKRAFYGTFFFLDALCAWFVRVFCADKHIGVMNACFLRTAFLHPHNKHGKMLSAEMSL